MKKLVYLFLFFLTTLQAQQVEEVYEEIFNQFPNVRDFAMDRDQSEIYFTVESYKKGYSFIAVIKKENGKWQEPRVTSFSGQHKDLEPFLSVDEKTLYFATNRVDNNLGKSKKDVDIWYVTRETKSSQWSEPKSIGSPINTEANEFYPAVNRKGDLFFTAEYKNSKGREDIYVSRLINGKYTTPVSLGSEINSSKYEFNAYVSPDESFIIFTSYGRDDDLGGGDLYISRKDKNGNWQTAQNLGKAINSNKIDYCPFVDIDTKTLYFTSDRNDIPKSFDKKMSLEEMKERMKKTPNGLSRIYKSLLIEK